MSDTYRAIVAELLGTFVLVFVGGLAILSVGVTGGITAGVPSSAGLVVIAFGFGLALLAGLYAFGEVSGGHYNPAVSLGMFLDNRISSNTFIQYLVAQVGGASIGALVLASASSIDAVAGTATVVGPATSTGGALALELLATAVFVAVILKVTKSDANGTTVMLSIALTLVVIHLALVPLTGASVNPARTFGSALVGSEFGDFWIYIVGPFVGAGLGWFLYRLTDSGDFNR